MFAGSGNTGNVIRHQSALPRFSVSHCLTPCMCVHPYMNVSLYVSMYVGLFLYISYHIRVLYSWYVLPYLYLFVCICIHTCNVMFILCSSLFIFRMYDRYIPSHTLTCPYKSIHVIWFPYYVLPYSYIVCISRHISSHISVFLVLSFCICVSWSLYLNVCVCLCVSIHISASVCVLSHVPISFTTLCVRVLSFMSIYECVILFCFP